MLNKKKVDFATASIKDKIFDKLKKNFVEKPPNFIEDLQNDKIDHTKYLIETGLIGTPEYLSPESLIEGDSSPAVDLWALGCIIYLFFHGTTPFKDKTNKLIFNRIENLEYFLDENLNEDIKDIIKKLLKKNPLERLGNGTKEFNLDFNALKKHNFFKGIDWENLYNLNPPFSTKKLLLNKNKIKNNSTDNLLGKSSISISKSARKSNLSKIISENNLTLLENDINNINNSIKDEMKNLYGEDNDYFNNNNNKNNNNNNNVINSNNIIINSERPKDINEEYEIILKKNEIRKSIKNQELLKDVKDEVLYEG